MKRFIKPLLLFVCSFALGVFIAPTIETEKEPVSEPTQKPMHHYLNRYGERIRRTQRNMSSSGLAQFLGGRQLQPCTQAASIRFVQG